MRVRALPAQYIGDAVGFLAGRGHAPSSAPSSAVPGMFCRAGYTFPLRESDAQLGLGLNAETRFDGTVFRNTGDFARYLAHSDDFAAVASRVG